jgi:hypothetical protein
LAGSPVKRWLLIFLVLSVAAFGANGDIAAVRIVKDTCAAGISCNGWAAEIDVTGLGTGGTYALGLGANNSPSTAKVVFTVTSPGYDATGALGTVTRTVYGTFRLRKPYPNDSSADETAGPPVVTRVGLSDYIYSADTVTVSIAAGYYTQGGTPSNAVTNLAVTNNSTTTYADTKPIGRWVRPVQYDRITGNFILEAVVFNRFAKNGKPLAAVKFTVSDTHSHSVTSTVTAMTVSSQTGDQNPVLVYAATIDVSTLTQGDVLTCNFKAYPWAGDATAVLDSNSGVTQPDARLSDLLLLNDKSGTYGGGVAVVDAVNGHASAAATWVSANQAAAEASYVSSVTNSYADVSYAAAAIKAWNNANLARNNASGGIVLVTGTAGDTNGIGNGSEVCAAETWLTITHLSTVLRSAAGFDHSTNASVFCQRLRFLDLTFTGAATYIVGSGTVWLDSNYFNVSGASGNLYSVTAPYATRNTVIEMPNGQFGKQNGPHWALVRGNLATVSGFYGDAYAFVGNAGVQPLIQAPGNTPQNDNAIIAFNSHYNFTNGFWVEASVPFASGMAIVQTVVEELSGASGFAGFSSISPDTGFNNIIIWDNTTVGGRDNLFYNDYAAGAATPITNVSFRGNSFDSYSIKCDALALNGTATGCLAQSFAVGFASNWIYVDTFLPDFIGTDSIFNAGSLTASYVNCAAYGSNAWGASGCSNSGSGNYHLTASASARSLVASGTAVLPYDLAGVARKNDGTGAAGAFEFVPTSTSNGGVSVIVP